MFTGIVKEIGRVVSCTPNREGVLLEVASTKLIKEIVIDDSISINGVCQTAVSLNESTFKVQAVRGTLDKTTLGSLKPGDQVNLELALQLKDRLGGHLVQGHVNCVAPIYSANQYGENYLLKFKIDEDLVKYVVKEGSITVDGISLTVFDFDKSGIVTLSIIPHTWNNTILKEKRSGDYVNIEVDIIAKYVESMLKVSKNKKAITEEWLHSKGF